MKCFQLLLYWEYWELVQMSERGHERQRHTSWMLTPPLLWMLSHLIHSSCRWWVEPSGGKPRPFRSDICW